MPVSEVRICRQRATGTKCITIKYTANALSRGPYPACPAPTPSGRDAVWTVPQEQATACCPYSVTFTLTSGISCC